MATQGTQRRFLVVVRAGDSSLHRKWFVPDKARNWDLWVSYFGDEPEVMREQCNGVFQQKGAKWPALYRLVAEHSDRVFAYDAVLFIDDDMWLKFDKIDTLFDIFSRYDLLLAQPALTVNSYASHLSVIQNTSFRLRFTNFVECMNPLFSREGLRRCYQSFNENVSGWGIDYLWTMLLGKPELAISVIDAVAVEHTRPVGGPLYGVIAAQGTDPSEQMCRVLEKHGISQFVHIVFDAIPAEERSNGASESGMGSYMSLLTALIRGSDRLLLRDKLYILNYLLPNFGISERILSHLPEDDRSAMNFRLKLDFKLGDLANLLIDLSHKRISTIIQIGNRNAKFFPMVVEYLSRFGSVQRACLFCDGDDEDLDVYFARNPRAERHRFSGDLMSVKNVIGEETFDLAVVSISADEQTTEELLAFAKSAGRVIVSLTSGA